ncbi:MAG: glutamine-hydrolyzing GMP synthase [Oscillospiraceae bacterium]|nr:glutamine-hydrolyzing GMP synthase [Oscillospiraceae bacterium]
MPDNQRVVILNFGGQYCQLIARRVREAGVYCEALPHDTPIEKIRAANPIGLILSGSPASTLGPDAPYADPALLGMGAPVLGICYGMQWMAHHLGGAIESGTAREYGRVTVRFTKNTSGLTQSMPDGASCWMSHADLVTREPEGFAVLASSDNCPVAAMADPSRKLYGVQFHPEVTHTERGRDLINGFLYNICGASGDWSMESFIKQKITELRERIGGGRVLLGLSGGVDSAVTAAILSTAIGGQLTCVYVDHGLMRKDETEQVREVFEGHFDLKLIQVDASDLFFSRLEGVTEPERKRKIIGAAFVEVFAAEAAKLGGQGGIEFLAQGTTYPDVIESGQAAGAAVIKSHHNVGGLPANIGFKGLIEPIRMLFKDEVRAVGERLGLPEQLVWRQPFPGPGLAIRCLGEVTRDRIAIVRASDAILREEIAKAGLARDIQQYLTVLTGARSVGVMGDGRTYENTIAVRAVTTDDFMTSDWARIPYDALARISSRIVNEAPRVNRVVYDITTKPPASIEWE